MASVTASRSRFSDAQRAEIGDAFSRVLWTIAMIPTFSIAMSLSIELRAWLTYGEWPGYGSSDVDEFTLHLTLAVMSAVVSLAAVAFVLLVSLAGIAMGHSKTVIHPAVITIGSFTLLFAIARSDVGGIGSWLAT